MNDERLNHSNPEIPAELRREVREALEAGALSDAERASLASAALESFEDTESDRPAPPLSRFTFRFPWWPMAAAAALIAAAMTGLGPSGDGEGVDERDRNDVTADEAATELKKQRQANDKYLRELGPHLYRSKRGSYVVVFDGTSSNTYSHRGPFLEFVTKLRHEGFRHTFTFRLGEEGDVVRRVPGVVDSGSVVKVVSVDKSATAEVLFSEHGMPVLPEKHGFQRSEIWGRAYARERGGRQMIYRRYLARRVRADGTETLVEILGDGREAKARERVLIRGGLVWHRFTEQRVRHAKVRGRIPLVLRAASSDAVLAKPFADLEAKRIRRFFAPLFRRIETEEQPAPPPVLVFGGESVLINEALEPGRLADMLETQIEEQRREEGEEPKVRPLRERILAFAEERGVRGPDLARFSKADTPELASLLLPLADFRNERARRRIAGLIAELGPKALSRVEAEVRKPSKLQERALMVLASIGEPGARRLMRMIQEPRAEIRRLAAFGLGHVLQQTKVPRSPILPSISEEVRETAIRLLHSKLRDPDSRVRGQALVVLTTSDHGRVDAIRPLLADPDPSNRRTVLWALRHLEGRHASLLPTALRAAADRDAGVRAEATALLGYLVGIGKDATFVETLFKASRDPEAEVRVQALHALERIVGESPRGKTADQVLGRVTAFALHDETEELRRLARWKLTRMRKPALRVLNALKGTLFSATEEIRIRAALALAALGRPGGEILEAARRGPDSAAARAVEAALDRMGIEKEDRKRRRMQDLIDMHFGGKRPPPGESRTQRRAAELREMVAAVPPQAESRIRSIARELAERGPRAVSAALTELARPMSGGHVDRNDRLRTALESLGATALRQLAERVEASDSGIRNAAWRLVARLPESGTKLALQALKHLRPETRSGAARLLLARLGSTFEVEGMRAALRTSLDEDPDPRVRVVVLEGLGAAGLVKEARLLDLLRDREATVQVAALAALEKSIGPGGKLVPVLLTAFRSDHGRTRAQAVFFMGRLDASLWPRIRKAVATAASDRSGGVRIQALDAAMKFARELKNNADAWDVVIRVAVHDGNRSLRKSARVRLSGLRDVPESVVHRVRTGAVAKDEKKSAEYARLLCSLRGGPASLSDELLVAEDARLLVAFRHAAKVVQIGTDRRNVDLFGRLEAFLSRLKELERRRQPDRD